MATIEIWSHDDGYEVTCAPKKNCDQLRAQGLLPVDAKLLHSFQARTWLEAMQGYNKFMKYGEYNPARLPNGELEPGYEDLLED